MSETAANAMRCACGGMATWQRRAKRLGYSERIVCPACGLSTPWRYAGPNGEHRPELAYDWQTRARGARA